MACVYEGDTILLSVREQRYFVHSLPPIRKKLPDEVGPVALKERLMTDGWEESFDQFPFNHAGLYPVSNDKVANRQIFSNIHFLAFEVLPERAVDSKTDSSVLKDTKPPATKLVYGQKIKLLHVASNTYLSLPTTDYSTSFVTLKATADESCLFFFQPLWKGKLIGEIVCPQDEVLLESVKYRGYCVTPVDDKLSGSFEPETAYYKCGFVVHVHSSVATSTDKESAIRGGSVIRLSNALENGYLCGKGSTALAGHTLQDKLRSGMEIQNVADILDLLEIDLEHSREPTVGYKMRGSRKDLLSADTTYKTAPVSGDCYWQLEKWENPLDGSPFEFGESFCLKHLPTQRYLAVKKDTDNNFELIMVDEQNSADYIYQFVLESASSSEEVIMDKTDAVFRIAYGAEHTPEYFSLSMTHNHESTESSSKFLLPSKEREQSVVRIKQVDFVDHLYDVYYVESIKNVLMTLNMLLHKYPSRELIPDHYLYVLDVAANWLKERSYIRRKTRTKLLRTNHVIDLLVSCLAWSEIPPKELGLEVCYVLEWFVKVPSRLSHLYFVAKSEGKTSLLDALVMRLGQGINIKKVLSPLVDRGGPAAKPVTVKLHATGFNLEMLNVTIDTMEFFSALCLIDGVPFKKMQDYICEILIKLRTNFERCTSEAEALEVAQIVHKNNDHVLDFQFWVIQLKLFSRICKGSNGRSIKFVKKFVSFDTTCTNILIGVNAENVHPVFKSAYLEFLMSAYVDPVIDSSGSTIDNIWHFFVEGNLKGNDQPLKGAGLTQNVLDTLDSPNTEQIKHLIETMNDVIEADKVLDAFSQEGRNNITYLCDVVAAMKRMVSYGFSLNVGDEVLLHLQPLIDILDGRSDRYPGSPAGQSGTHYSVAERYKFKEEYVPLFKLKTKVIGLLKIYLKQLIYFALEQFLYGFSRGRYTEDQQWHHPPILNHFEGLFFPYREKPVDLLHEYQWFDTSNSDGQKLVQILEDLMLYGNDNLRAASAGLLSAMYNKEETMLEDAELSCIVSEADTVYIYCAQLGTFSDNDKVLLSLYQGTANAMLLPILTALGDAMIVNKDESKGNARWQNIVFTSGIFSILMSYALKYSRKSDPPELQSINEWLGISISVDTVQSLEPEPDDSQLLRLRGVCMCLQMMCRGNARIKRKMSATFTSFLDTKLAVSSVACLLTEMLTDNRDLSEHLKKDDVRQLYVMAVDQYSENNEYLEFFTTLQALIRPFKSSAESCVAVHQKFVARLFLDTYKDYFCEFMMKDQATERQELLRISPDTDDANKLKLLILLHLTSLLATCCEGQSRFAQEICDSIFTFEELLDILISVDIPPVRKVPFACLLAGAYLSTDKKFVSWLSGNEQFWDVDGFIRATKNSLLQHSDAEGIRIHLRKLFTLHLSWNDVINDSDELKGALQYLVEGLGPLVTVFCEKDREISYDKRARGKEIVEEIGNLIMNQLTGNSIQGRDVLKWHEECSLQVTTSYEDPVHKDEFRVNEQLRTVVSKLKNKLRLATRKDEERLFIEEVIRLSPDGLRNMQLLKLLRRRIVDADSSFAILKASIKNPRILRRRSRVITFTAGVEETKRLCNMLKAQNNRLNDLTASELSIMEQTVHVILEMFGVLLTSVIEIKEYDSEQLRALQEMISDSPFAEFAKSLLGSDRRNVAIYVLAFFCVFHYNNNDEERIYDLITEDGYFFRVMEKLIRGVHSSFNQFIRVKESDAKRRRDSRQTLSIHADEVDSQIGAEQTDENIALLMMMPTLEMVIDRHGILAQQKDYEPEKEQEDSLFLANAALDTISVFCYGQNRKMQNLLRNPYHCINRCNFVREVAVLLQTLVRIPGSQATLITCKSKAIKALIAMCSGNFLNQWSAMEGQAIDSINLILRSHSAEPNIKSLAMESRAVKLLDVLLQETAKDCSHIVMLVFRDLDISSLVQSMIDVYTMYEEKLKKLNYIPDGSDSDQEAIIQRNLFRAYHILRSLADHKKMIFASFLNKHVKLSEEQSVYKQYQPLWDYLYEHTRSIEIKYFSKHDNKKMLVRVYFPFHSSQTFNEEEKSVFQTTVNRDKLEDKHREMLNWTHCATTVNRHKAKLQRIPLLFPLLSGFSSQFRRALLVLLTVALNVCVLALFIVPDSVIKEQERNPSLVFISNPQLRWPAYLYYFLAYPFIILSLWMVLEYFIVEWPNFEFITSNMKMAVFQLEVWIKRNVRFLYNPIRRAYNRRLPDDKDRQYIFEPPVYYQCFDIDFFGLRPLYRIIFLISAVLGAISINFGYVYCLCLPYVFIYNLEMQNIINAVSNKAWQLISFTGVILAILWFYTVISFAFLYNFFDESKNLYCDSLLQCYVTVVRDGLLSSYGGAIPVTYVNQPRPDFGIFLWRAVIDISFYFSITLIVFPIIISIFSDSFNQLRDKMNKMMKDQQSVCFICGIGNDRFERDIDTADKGSAFYDHTHNDHYVYSYIYYGIYVNRKPTKLRTTFENYIFEKINEDKFDFYPKREALVLPD